MNGHSYITPLVAESRLGSLMNPRSDRRSPPLTPRQREVLQLLAQGSP
jgi:DNA-binding NarL/FixJ family response regulator